MGTPKKKDCNSSVCLKSKSKSSHLKMKAKEQDKSGSKLSPHKRSSEKRTTRKKVTKDAQELKTNKKSMPVFVV